MRYTVLNEREGCGKTTLWSRLELSQKYCNLNLSHVIMKEINWCDCCGTDVSKWDKISCFIPQPDKDYGPHPKSDWWGKEHTRIYRKNDGTCIAVGCRDSGFPYCEGHDSP